MLMMSVRDQQPLFLVFPKREQDIREFVPDSEKGKFYQLQYEKYLHLAELADQRKSQYDAS